MTADHSTQPFRLSVFFTLIVSIILAFFPQSAQAGWKDKLSPSKNWQRAKDYAKKKVDRSKAEQELHYGLKLPDQIDPTRPLVVLIHGLDGDAGIWTDLALLLDKQGQQVAYFNYPNDAAIAESGDRFTRAMHDLHTTHADLRIHIIAHSMGSLVSRYYIEHKNYAGNIDRLIMVGAPNHGSKLAGWRWPLELIEHAALCCTDKNWSPIWMFTDGTGQAGDDLRPDSRFLKNLNALPRNPAVRYTSIVGNQHMAIRLGADALLCVEECLPASNRPGLKQARQVMHYCTLWVGNKTTASDGAVDNKSSQLDGVTDVICLKADHNTLLLRDGKKPPVAWETIRQRLE